jgi:hypothetical protein
VRTLQQAVLAYQRGELIGGLAGCPEGGWGDTQQARQQLLEQLPLRQLRSYTLEQLIDAVYYVDSCGKYRARSI